jgi:outer membrane protein OmpA-like peptidoglycan-associated protein
LKNGAYEKAIPMKYPINSPCDDYGVLFVTDTKTAYFTSNRTLDNQGNDDIMYFDLLDQDFPASIYTIGYQPKKEVEEIAIIEEPVKEEPVIALSKKPLEMNIYFDFDKFDIRADAVKSIDSISKFMKDYPDTKLILGGYCDIRGNAEYNINLSESRNNSVIADLQVRGIDKKRIVATAYGFKHLVNRCSKGVTCSGEEHQMNRRVEFRFDNEKPGKVFNKKSAANKMPEHVVKKGETLYSISKMHNMHVDELKRMNDMNNETIVTGQVLIVGL